MEKTWARRRAIRSRSPETCERRETQGSLSDVFPCQNMQECKWSQERTRKRIKKRRKQSKREGRRAPTKVASLQPFYWPRWQRSPDTPLILTITRTSVRNWKKTDSAETERKEKERMLEKRRTTLVCQIQPSFHTQARGDCRFSKGQQRDRRVKKETGDGFSASLHMFTQKKKKSFLSGRRSGTEESLKERRSDLLLMPK